MAMGTNGVGPYDTNYAAAGQNACGGAIYLASGMLEVKDTVFRGNIARGGQGYMPGSGGTSGGHGAGGAIYSKSAVAATRCLFETNAATGGTNGPSGQAGKLRAGRENAGGELTVLKCIFEGTR
jgi:hypothetical protein